MADLRARFRAYDATPMPELWSEIERRAAAKGSAPATRVTGLGPTWRGPAPTAATRRLVLALVLLGLLVIALLGASLVGGPLRDPFRADAPPRLPTLSPAPSEGPLSEMTLRFTSDLYPYSIAVPEGWESRAATRAWDGFGQALPSEMDELAAPGDAGRDRFTVAGRHPTTLPPQDLEQWMTNALGLPPELVLEGGHRACDFDGVLVPDRAAWGLEPEPTLEFADVEIGGQPARLRSICGHVDAVVLAQGGLYLLSLFTDGRIDGDEDLFNSIAGTIQFRSDGTPSPIPTSTPKPTSVSPAPSRSAVVPPGGVFESATYGYRIRFADDWEVWPTTSAWTDPVPWSLSVADEASPTGASGTTRFSVAARPVPDGWSERAWLDAFVPRPIEYEAWAGHGSPVHGHCFFKRGGGTTIVDSSAADWEATTIAGRPGYVRGTCGHVDGVLFRGDTAYVLSLQTNVLGAATSDGSAPLVSGDRNLFDSISATLIIDRPEGDQPAAAPTQRYDSVLYGYSIRYPIGWTAVFATTPWAVSGVREPAMSDELRGPEGRARLAIASRTRSDGMTPLQWITTFVPAPVGYLAGEEAHCATPGHQAIAAQPPNAWTEADLGQYRGWIRWLCGQVDAVFFTATHGYHLTYAVDDVILPYGETEVFDAFMKTFRLEP
jgi:hypothetical protein